MKILQSQRDISTCLPFGHKYTGTLICLSVILHGCQLAPLLASAVFPHPSPPACCALLPPSASFFGNQLVLSPSSCGCIGTQRFDYLFSGIICLTGKNHLCSIILKGCSYYCQITALSVFISRNVLQLDGCIFFCVHKGTTTVITGLGELK